MPGGLPLLAALIPEGHAITLIDEAVEAIDFDFLAQFDVIGVTGQIVQRERMREILVAARDLPATVIVGGPYASIDEGFFEGLCDTIFVGEADETWPVFLTTLANGEVTEKRYEQNAPTDVTRLPSSRLDLMKSGQYVSASIQYSRGCPFTCEFCDIIVIFGRRPRVKSPAQVLTELEAVRSAGFSVCFVVDDNFIGNKVAVKKLLPEIIAWQEKNGYPLVLSTEVTINLADDPDLMDLMHRANFRDVFIGIESPRAESLTETKKLQNIRGDSMSDKLARIRDAGMVVSAGFIVGFDEDDLDIFDEQVRFIEENNIGQASLGFLMALPKTPLYDRLKAEGRLREELGLCNFLPKQMTHDQLMDGCADTLRRLYSADAFFGRITRNVSASAAFRKKRTTMIDRHRSGRKSFLGALSGVTIALRLGRKMARAGMLRQGIITYFQQYRHQRRDRNMLLSGFMSLCAMHWHYYRLTHLDPDTTARHSADYFGAKPAPPLARPTAERREDAI